MANWASTSYVVEGPKETLQKIYDAIQHPTVIEPNSDESWEGNVLNTLNIKWINRNDDRENGKYMRGFLSGAYWVDDNLRFDAEEAWGVTDFDEVLESNFPDIKVYWSTEESGMGIYETNDKEGKYFKDRFYADVCIKDVYYCHYFQFKSSLIKWLFDITEGKIKSEEDIEKFNKKHEEAGTDDENYISVYEIKVTA